MAAAGLLRGPGLLPCGYPFSEACHYGGPVQSSTPIPCIPQFNSEAPLRAPAGVSPATHSRKLQVPLRHVSRRQLRQVCKASVVVTAEKSSDITQLQRITETVPEVALRSVRAFGPATVANLGPGFDYLGCALNGLGDYVTAEVSRARYTYRSSGWCQT